jgi:hypothetical protein
VTLDVVGGKVESQSGYKFDKEYEMVAGEWKFQYWRDEQLLLEQTFNVYDPTLLPASEATAENQATDNPPAPEQESAAQSTAQPASQPSTKAVTPLY